MIENTITTNENLVQDNSSIEYVSPETNPITPVQTETKNLVSVTPLFDSNATHNGEACIASLDPKDERENKFWFTVAMLVAIYNESDKTIRNNIEELAQEGELGDCKIFQRRINIEDARGVPHPTTIYNLTVLNRLGMCCFRKNKKAKEVRDKFNDVLVKHETQAQPTIFDYARALIAEKERSDALEAQNKALTAERDEAIRTKSWIGDKKTASAMGTAGALSKKCDRLEKELDKVKSEMNLQVYNACSAIRKEFEEDWKTARDWCYKHQLPVSVKELKWIVSDRLVKICAEYPDRKPQWRRNSSDIRIFPKWACDILDKMYDEDDTFLAEYRTV